MSPMHDTHSALRDLEAAGIESMHAEAIVGVISKEREELATKTDLAHAVAATKADLAAAVTRLEALIEARIERAMNRNLVATITVGGVVIAAVKLL